jgi:hypothetical protein
MRQSDVQLCLIKQSPKAVGVLWWLQMPVLFLFVDRSPLMAWRMTNLPTFPARSSPSTSCTGQRAPSGI